MDILIISYGYSYRQTMEWFVKYVYFNTLLIVTMIYIKWYASNTTLESQQTLDSAGND